MKFGREETAAFLVTISSLTAPFNSVTGKFGDINLSGSNTWEPLVSTPEILQKAFSVLSKKTGAKVGATPQSVTEVFFRGTEYLNFSLTLEFVTYSDPKKDVLLPVQKLHLLSAPITGTGGTLAPPSEVQIIAGNFLNIPKAVINSFGVDFSKEVVNTLPMKASVTIGVQVSVMYGSRDIKKLYPGV